MTINEQRQIATHPSLIQAPAPFMSHDQWQLMIEQARVLVKSGFLPKSLDTPEKAVAVMLTGRELGIGTMTALRSIHIINGVPTLESQLMAALIYRDHGDDALDIVESTETRCTIQYKRRGWRQPRQYTYTITDAKTAGLLSKENWRYHPKAMLRARAISAVARIAFQDSTCGLYTPEEIDPDLRVDEEGKPVNLDAVDQAPGIGLAAVSTEGEQAQDGQWNELTLEVDPQEATSEHWKEAIEGAKTTEELSRLWSELPDELKQYRHPIAVLFRQRMKALRNRTAIEWLARQRNRTAQEAEAWLREHRHWSGQYADLSDSDISALSRVWAEL